MVALLEAQSAQLGTMREVVSSLEGRLMLRDALDATSGEEVRQSVADLRVAIEGLRRLAKKAGPDAEGLADDAADRVDQLAVRVGELLSLGRPASISVRREHLSDVVLADILCRAIDSVHGLDRASVVVRSDGDLLLATAPARLAAIVGALLDNAIRHGAPPIEVAADYAFDDIVLRVRDYGRGLPPGDTEALFEAFTAGPTSRGGHGVGLYLARKLARSLGGDVEIGPGPSGGTIAAVTLPQRRNQDPEGLGPE